MIDRCQSRRRRVARDPGLANTGDIARLLMNAGLASEPARDVLAAATARDITPRTMWVWSHRFGTESLVSAVRAGLGHAELLEHLIADTTPDLAGLRVLADLAR